MELAQGYPVWRWISESDIASVPYAQYWNDASEEQGKPWDLSAGGYASMETYLAGEGLLADVRHGLNVAKQRFGWHPHGVGADLASGTLWAVPLLTAITAIDKVYCVEYSRHRLLDIGPQVLRHYGVPPEKVVLCLGSFYDLRLSNTSLDFVLLSQAFHHADRPTELLQELHRVLVSGGIALITGEPRFGIKESAKYTAKRGLAHAIPPSLSDRLLGPGVRDQPILPLGPILTDPILGDHCYTGRVYRQMFHGMGFDVCSVRGSTSTTRSFVLMRR